MDLTTGMIADYQSVLIECQGNPSFIARIIPFGDSLDLLSVHLNLLDLCSYF